ncbi:hypothetical protein C8Q76DRAFT_799528 [Earliella scabrosa]|nr:hypothetical protein C8Q76DRAFT_799528 [Earliella scabrosa]
MRVRSARPVVGARERTRLCYLNSARQTYAPRPGSLSTHTIGHSSIASSLSVSVTGARYASGAPSLASPRDPRDPFNSPRDHPHTYAPLSFASPSRASSSSASLTRVPILSQYSRGSQLPSPPSPDPFLSSRESAEGVEARIKLRERERERDEGGADVRCGLAIEQMLKRPRASESRGSSRWSFYKHCGGDGAHCANAEAG